MSGSNRPLVVLSLFALLLRLGLAWLDLRSLITTIPDDAFYYFGVARNIVNGYGVTFDGTNWTNGFHPLWMTLLLPLYAISGSDHTLAIHLALSISAVLDIWVGWVIYKLVKLITDDSLPGLMALFFYLFNPGIIKESLNGLETTLSTSMVATTALLYVRAWHYKSEPSDSFPWTLLGITVGLALLARTDNVFVIGFVTVAIILLKRGWGLVLGAWRVGVITTLLLLPWLIWNLTQFGTIMQSSGDIYPYVIRASMQAHHSVSLLESLFIGFVIAYQWAFVYIPLYYFLWQQEIGAIYYALVAGLGGLMLLVRTRFTAVWRGRMKILIIPCVGMLSNFLVHSFIRLYPRSWYFVPVVFYTSIALGITASYFLANYSLNRSQRNLLIYGLGTLLGVAFVLRAVQEWDRYPWQAEMYEAGNWVRENTSDQEKIGAFNSGIIGYLVPNRVVNLDGVINWGANQAIRNEELGEYIRSQDVRMVIDFPSSIEQYQLFMKGEVILNPLRVWPKFPEPAKNTYLTLYAVSFKASNASEASVGLHHWFDLEGLTK